MAKSYEGQLNERRSIAKGTRKREGMRAHKALELLKRTQFRNLDYSLTVEHEKAKSLLEQAVTFDFGQLRPELEHGEFGLNLLSRRMLKLPYEIVFFSCGLGHYLAQMAREGGTLFVASLMPTPENLACVGTRVTILGHHPENFDARWWHISRSVPTHIRGSLTDDQAAAEACMGANIVCGLVAMLMGKDVEKVHFPSSPALNKARKRKGRVPINDAYEIKIRPHVVTNTGSTSGTGRTHASPRRPGEPISPCLVNAADEDAKLILPKDYVMPSPVEWRREKDDQLMVRPMGG